MSAMKSVVLCLLYAPIIGVVVCMVRGDGIGYIICWGLLLLAILLHDILIAKFPDKFR